MKRFYLGMNFNGGGIEIAKQLMPQLEIITKHQCTSRWIWSEAHESQEYRRTIAVTDLADIARSDYVILAPLTNTARGCHVELGLALALDKPVYLYRPKNQDGVGFDVLCNKWEDSWIKAIEGLIKT